MSNIQKKKIYIFDTTLRDGQQSPGAGMTFNDNLVYADFAHKMNIDILEAGFPSASNTDFNIVKTISRKMKSINSNMIIAGLCQLREGQIIKTMESLVHSNKINKARIHTYVPVDPNLAMASLGNKFDKNKITKNVYDFIKIATNEGFQVEFSPEGYSRQGENFSWTTDLIRAAVQGGATIINCPDTIGGACIREGKNYFVNKMQSHSNIIKKEFPSKDIIFSSHCHNDFGLALDNSMNAVFDGPARQVECCMNGIGERAGNASLEQVIMYLASFGKQEDMHYFTDINPLFLKEASDFIAKKMLPRQPHSPIVGINAMKHTSGGHTNAILNNPLVYQPFNPKKVGSSISFVFGPLSGGNHAKKIIEEFGYTCFDFEKAKLAQDIKDFYSDRRKGITDLELIEAYKYIKSPIKDKKISYSKDRKGEIKIYLEGDFFDKKHLEASYLGENSALYCLVREVSKYIPEINVYDYNSKAINNGTVNAQSESIILIKTKDNNIYKGIAQNQDIEISALKAFVNAVNNFYIEENCTLKKDNEKDLIKDKA